MKRLTTLILFSLVLIIASCGNNRNISIEGVDGPYILLNGKNLVITTTFENIDFEEKATYKIPEFDYSYIEITASEDNKTVLAYKFNIYELIEFDDGKLPLINLPDKRSIPGIDGGLLPGIDFAIDKFDHASIYLSPTKLGIFIPVIALKDFSSMATFDFFVNNNSAGTVTVIGGEEEHHVSGMILMLDLNQNVKDDLLNYLDN